MLHEGPARILTGVENTIKDDRPSGSFLIFLVLLPLDCLEIPIRAELYSVKAHCRQLNSSNARANSGSFLEPKKQNAIKNEDWLARKVEIVVVNGRFGGEIADGLSREHSEVAQIKVTPEDKRSENLLWR